MNNEAFYNLLEHPENLDENTLGQLEELTARYPFFQAGWMLYLKNLKNLKNTGNPEYENVLKKVALMVPDRKQLHRFLHDVKQPKPNTVDVKNNLNREYDLGESEENKPGNSLIDKFLSSNPGPIRLEKDNAESENEDVENEVVEKSDSENEELITETLAMIYFEQKKYDKALDAFRKLSLKYPEKSIYFATRIEEIEKLKNI